MGIPVCSCSCSLSTQREIERRLSQKKVGDGGVEEASRERGVTTEGSVSALAGKRKSQETETN